MAEQTARRARPDKILYDPHSRVPEAQCFSRYLGEPQPARIDRRHETDLRNDLLRATSAGRRGRHRLGG